MSENVSPKYYWENKERLQIKAREKDQILSKEEKEKKSNNMVMNVTKISQKMKNKRLMIIKKIYYRMRKNTLLKESILI